MRNTNYQVFHFTGNTGWIRIVPSKQEVGLWIYELCAVLSSGLPLLVHFKTHTHLKKLGEKIPTITVMNLWADVIVKKGGHETMLVSDSYYLSREGLKSLQNRGINFVCSVQKQRFLAYVDFVKKFVRTPGDISIAYSQTENLTFAYHWDHDPNVGKKYCLTNAVTRTQGKPRTKILPVYDGYKLIFSVCDEFNRRFHDRTWPHRASGGGKPGEPAARMDFYFSSILQNTLNIWIDLKEKREDTPFEDFCLKLADELFQRSATE